MGRIFPVVAALLIASGCDPVTFDSAAPFAPPEHFRWDYVATLVCMGFERDEAERRFEQVVWIHAINLRKEGRDIGGAWREPHRILLSKGPDASSPVRNHEAIHDVLQPGDHSHPAFGRPDRWDGCEVPPL